ncbi:MAG: LPS assembly protein LptD [Rhodospirillales bacterium]|nr:LPS assembly protein LptD [Rhodospirillales bacterium]
MNYDSELNIVTASGNVEVIHEDRVLVANTITYNQKSDILTASGKVSLIEPSGEVIFAEYVELTGDFKDGIIQDIRIILSDGSRIAANGARRSNKQLMELRKAVYSPCNICTDDPGRPPLWQIKAVKIVHDKGQKVVEYSDAWLEVAGIPIAYTPYFSHPDPTVKRKSGFLVPSFGHSSDLGYVFKAPYFWNIAPDRDATITPIYATDEGAALDVEYRHYFRNGKFFASGSATQDSDNDVRGHFFSKGRFDIDDRWRWGFDFNRASDETYLRRYGYTSDNTLISNVFTEGFGTRSYLSANAYDFQSMAEGVVNGPLIMPLLDYNYIGDSGPFGGRPSLDMNLMTLTRDDGTDSRRLSIKAGWALPYIGPAGDVWRLSTSLRGDLYHTDDLYRPGPKDTYTGFSGRIIPQASLDWRYPFVKTEGSISQVIEPMVSFIVSPYGGNPDTISNEDSIDFEFDDTNLFSDNRFPGFDRVEGGPRFNYGLKWGAFGKNGGSTTIAFGQSYRFRADDTFSGGSGLEDNFSDFVGSVRISPGPYFDLFYRTRLDKDNLEPKRNEINIATGIPALRINAGYVYFDHTENSEFPGREEMNISLSSQINRYWRARAAGIRDLSDDGGMRNFGVGLVYEDECFIFSTDFRRDFYEDRDLKPSDSIVFRATFKTLGEVSSGFSRSQ